MPFPVPCGGMLNYLDNRITPGIRAQLDLVKNRDYYGRQILKGDAPERILRGLEYELESMAPLALGAGAESIRTKGKSGEVAQQMIGQFAGTNIQEVNKIAPLRKKWTPDLEAYNKIPADIIEQEKAKQQDPKFKTRKEYRHDNPIKDAKLFILGDVSSFESDKAPWVAANGILHYKIDPYKINAVKKRVEYLQSRDDAGLARGEWTDIDELLKNLASSDGTYQKNFFKDYPMYKRTRNYILENRNSNDRAIQDSIRRFLRAPDFIKQNNLFNSYSPEYQGK